MAHTEKIKDPLLNNILNSDVTPLKLLKYFVSNEVVDNILHESEIYADQVKETHLNALSNFSMFNADEYWNFMALHMLMGIHKLPEMRNYWSKNELMHSPIFKEKMSRNRFFEILRTLHFSNNRFPNPNNRFWKLGNFLENLLCKFKNSINAGEYLCVDESLVGYKGRLSFRQYIPNKRCRFGVKFFVLVDTETNLILNMIAYQGKKTQLEDCSKELGVGGAATYTLILEWLHNNHRIVTDSWFISPNLATKLLENGTHLLGTCRKQRKNMPKMVGKLKTGTVETYSTDQILIQR